MREETDEQQRSLRSGYTTGACATATSLSAAKHLLTREPSTAIDIWLPRGEQVSFQLIACDHRDDIAHAATIKDAGDDPDATHGATVFADVRLTPAAGIRFAAAEGVGTVTRMGLPLAVGEPAINPIPRQMMCEHLQSLADRQGYLGGFEVAIGIVDGARIAERTMNGRLGIVGGLSILGTTGIVRPYSCAAYIASIHQGIDVARANGVSHLAACTGSTSERAARALYNLEDIALLEMGDFAGAVLKYLRKHPVAHVTLVGGFGKLTKLAGGHLNLHNSQSSIDFAQLATLVPPSNVALREAILASNTTAEVLQHCERAAVGIADAVCRHALMTMKKYTTDRIRAEVVAIDRNGGVVGRAG